MQVLIAHQSAIPHYRVAFYNKLHEISKNRDWRFTVVFDASQEIAGVHFTEAVDSLSFKFPTLPVRTRRFSLLGKNIVWQNCLWKARKFDAIIMDTHLTNLSYPIMALYGFTGKHIGFWGHLQNQNVLNPGPLHLLVQSLKLNYIKRARHFFAYTASNATKLVESGYASDKISVLNNTTDIEQDRSWYLNRLSERKSIRGSLNIECKRVILVVGRLIPIRQIPFLIAMFRELALVDANYHLLVIGDGPEMHYLQKLQTDLGTETVALKGAIPHGELLIEHFIAADVFVMPGMIGLAPLQALACDLAVVGRQADYHSPEVEYLNSGNSILLAADISPANFAKAIHNGWSVLTSEDFKSALFGSIQNLTLGNMAEAFADGVDRMLGD